MINEEDRRRALILLSGADLVWVSEEVVVVKRCREFVQRINNERSDRT